MTRAGTLEADGNKKRQEEVKQGTNTPRTEWKGIKELRLTSGRGGVLEGDEEAIIQQKEGRTVNPEQMRRATEHVKHQMFNGDGCDVQVNILKAEQEICLRRV